jgi:hypothetical protein
MKTMTVLNSLPRLFRAGLAAALVGLGGSAHAAVTGWEGTLDPSATAPTRLFGLIAKHDFVSTSDGNSHYAWGYAHDFGDGKPFPMQFPGPTLLVTQGETVRITLKNELPVVVSAVFPGQQGVQAVCTTTTLCANGLLTKEIQKGGTVEYSFVASQPGTYLYHSGTDPDLEVEMGLVGAIIVRPTGFARGTKGDHPNRKAYQQAGTNYDRENLFVLSEMDPDFHWKVYGQIISAGPTAQLVGITADPTTIRPSIWFINGRNAPDTMLEDRVYWLPTQPYNALPRMHPGERLLMRVVNVGRDLHPFHHHGNHAYPIARDGRVLSSAPTDLAKAPDLTSPDFTVRAVPGQTVDLIFEWTGKGLGWDIYGSNNGHTCTDTDSDGYDDTTREWCADHNKPIPVTLAGALDLSYGESWGGSPFLGVTGSLPQGHPGLNTTGGYFHMWHSHNEKEITTDDIFPGGMMTMLIVEPWSVDLDFE